jgi:hypothetical protein
MAISELVANIMTKRAIEDGIGFSSSQAFIPHSPTSRQRLFLDLDNEREVFYGGAAGGGKSDALLMAALEYVDVPGYAAVLLRKTYVDLARPGALMDRAHKWLGPTSAKWEEKDKRWVFPSGATLSFGYLEVENDKYKYQSAEFQFVGFDELTHFSETQYTYLFSRLRRLKGVEIPIRMRSGSNPGGYGGLWVKSRFIPEDFTAEDARVERVYEKTYIDEETGETKKRFFVPALMDDNPHLDQEEYNESLKELDTVTRAQLRRGDWSITTQGDILFMWDERQVLVKWSDFKRVMNLNTDNVPLHWQLGVFQDWGTTEAHPCVTGWFATAAENTPEYRWDGLDNDKPGIQLVGLKFMYRLMTRTRNVTAIDIKKEIYQKMAKDNEIPRTRLWEMSHEASSERNEYHKYTEYTPYTLPFINWETGKTRGIEQLKRAITPRHLDKPHPFNKGVMGHPELMIIVADEEYVSPKTDAGMARVRQEAPSYRWDVPKSGETPRSMVPFALFNDAMDVLRGAAAKYFPSIEEFTVEEMVDKRLNDRISFDPTKTLTEGQQISLAIAHAQVLKEMESELDLDDFGFDTGDELFDISGGY